MYENNSMFDAYVDSIYHIAFVIKNATDTARSASHLDLHLEMTKLYDKRDYLNSPIVNFPFISCSNISAALSNGVYISQLIRYSKACVSYFYGRHHYLINCYGISVSQMSMLNLRRHSIKTPICKTTQVKDTSLLNLNYTKYDRSNTLYCKCD
jgi:hypothetical protein